MVEIDRGMFSNDAVGRWIIGVDETGRRAGVLQSAEIYRRNPIQREKKKKCFQLEAVLVMSHRATLHVQTVRQQCDKWHKLVGWREYVSYYLKRVGHVTKTIVGVGSPERSNSKTTMSAAEGSRGWQARSAMCRLELGSDVFFFCFPNERLFFYF